MRREEFKRSARLPESARQEMLDRLDLLSRAERRSSAAHRGSQRKDTRWAFRHSDLAIAVEHPGGGTSRLLVFSRNLSAGGLSFLHQGFLYPKSRCNLMLPRADGTMQPMAGTIVACRHINGLLHEIGIRFDERIDPADFVKSPSPTPTDATDTLEMAELHGRVVVIDDNEMDRALLLHYLKMFGLTSTTVASSESALESVKSERGEIVITELNFPNRDGVELIKHLRESGFEGPIVVITAESDEARMTKAKDNGAAHVLTKPYDPDALMQLMYDLHKQIGAVLDRAVLFSSLEDQQNMRDLITQYVEQARVQARRIEKFTAEDNFAEVRQLCLSLKGSAGGYGFGPLSELAAETLKSLDANQALRKSISQLRSLCMLCDRLRTRSQNHLGSANASR
jgi:CheY-like chemotaxis protein